MPDWNCTLPSGRMMNRPSNPVEPPENALTATPEPRTLVPTRLPLRAFFSSQLNSSAPLSSASFTNALVTYCLLVARRPAAPNGALPAGALILWISTWSTPSLRAALASTGSIRAVALHAARRALRRPSAGCW